MKMHNIVPQETALLQIQNISKYTFWTEYSFRERKEHTHTWERKSLAKFQLLQLLNFVSFVQLHRAFVTWVLIKLTRILSIQLWRRLANKLNNLSKIKSAKAILKIDSLLSSAEKVIMLTFYSRSLWVNKEYFLPPPCHQE